VATACALLIFYRRNWIRIISALITTLRTRRIETSAERLAWLLVIATVPVGLTGLALEHTFRTLFAKPLAASVFLAINGVILFGAERLRRRAEARASVAAPAAEPAAVGANWSPEPDPGLPSSSAARPARGIIVTEQRSLDTLDYKEAGIIGLFQTFALLAGISRSGITMAAGLLRGLDHEDAAKFFFLLATPVILAAGVLKLPSLAGPAGAHIHGQILVGFLVAGIAAYLSDRFLTRYFTTRTLTPVVCTRRQIRLVHTHPSPAHRVYRLAASSVAEYTVALIAPVPAAATLVRTPEPAAVTFARTPATCDWSSPSEPCTWPSRDCTCGHTSLAKMDAA
jgi:undecaprenyl-diphosphatase